LPQVAPPTYRPSTERHKRSTQGTEPLYRTKDSRFCPLCSLLHLTYYHPTTSTTSWGVLVRQWSHHHSLWYPMGHSSAGPAL